VAPRLTVYHRYLAGQGIVQVRGRQEATVAEVARATAMGRARNIMTLTTLAKARVMGIVVVGIVDPRAGPLLTIREIAAGLGSASHLHPPTGECSALESAACRRRKRRPHRPISSFILSAKASMHPSDKRLRKWCLSSTPVQRCSGSV